MKRIPPMCISKRPQKLGFFFFEDSLGTLFFGNLININQVNFQYAIRNCIVIIKSFVEGEKSLPETLKSS